MQIEIKLDESCKEPKIIIVTDQMTNEIHALLHRLSDAQPKSIIGYQNDSLIILQQEDIVRIYAEATKVYAQTEQSLYTLRLRLYEAEERLDKQSFVRISNSEIIQLKKVKSMDLSLGGTICVRLQGDIKAFVSRRYIPKIKQRLGI